MDEWPLWAQHDKQLGEYYATEWGVPCGTEQGMFERLSLEVFQSGLSWKTILSRRDAFRDAFANFDPEVVAGFGPDKVEELLGNEAIIRNRHKIVSTITNANATLAIRDITSPWANVENGLPAVVWSARPETDPLGESPSSTPESAELAKRLKKLGFVHVGPTNVYAMMQAVGVVNDHPHGSRQRQTSATITAFLTPLRAGASS